MNDRIRTAFGTDHLHHADNRLLSEGELESLLAWWRTTAKDQWGNPLFCRHMEHIGRCDRCPPPLTRTTRCRR